MRMQDRLRAFAAVATLAVAGLLCAACRHPRIASADRGGRRGRGDQLDLEHDLHSRRAPPIDCAAQDFDLTWFENASIRPGSGNLTALDTQVTVFAPPLDPFFNGWHRALQGVACAPDRISAGQLATFVATVGSLRTAGDVTPLTIPGECALTGGLRLPADHRR